MKKNVFYLPILLLLLLIFIPAAVYGLYNHKLNQIHGDAVTNEDGILIFRNENGEKVGTYECKSDTCRQAPLTIDDGYLQHSSGTNSNFSLLSKYFALIEDEGNIKLYNLLDKSVVYEYSSIKNYGFDSNYLIVCDTKAKCGVLSLTDMAYIIEPSFDFIGVISENDMKELNNLVVKKDESWFIIDKSQNIISQRTSNPIYTFSDKYIITTSSIGYKVLSRDGGLLFSDLIIESTRIFGDYIVYQTSDGIYLSDGTNNIREFTSSDNLSFDIDNTANVLNIYEGEDLKESINYEDVSK